MKSIVVMGNARSGTSMTAGLLSILGVNMGELPVEKMENNWVIQNPKGAFENPDFIKLTSEMHKDWADGMGYISIKEKYDQRIKETIGANEKTFWGFKSAAVAPFLNMFVKNMGNPHIVTVIRNVIHNTQSWIVHMRDVFGTNVEFNKALKKMTENQDIIAKTVVGSPHPNIFVTYEDLKKDSWIEAQRLAKFIGVDPEGKEDEVREFIMPNYTTLDPS